MKKYLWIFIILIIIIGITILVFNKNNVNNEKNSGYIAEKTSLNTNNEEAKNVILEGNNLNNTDTNTNTNSNSNKKTKNKTNKKLSEFSTRLPKDTKARYSNIDLACDTLNGTVVKSGETFSLWNVLGCPTKEKGYRKAKTFTSSGKVTKSYGGGICQISTTIYNAVLEVKGLKIKERHEHSRDVVYIKDGKDAAVSYKSGDLKFKNTLDYDVKIEAMVESNKVRIKLLRI